MRITYLAKPEDPVFPIMVGKTSFAKEFNKRQKTLYKDGRVKKVDFEQVITVILDILIEDYDARHPNKKKVETKAESKSE